VPVHCEQSYHMFYLILPSLETRQALIDKLKERGILSVFHYLPLHLSAMGLQAGGRQGQCPVTERVSDCLLRLPFYNDLTVSEQAEIVDLIRQFRTG
jgi:dTDP-4-amino-4,6-dideoxygalactose transaminase